jgi:hypothetical protein
MDVINVMRDTRLGTHIINADLKPLMLRSTLSLWTTATLPYCPNSVAVKFIMKLFVSTDGLFYSFSRNVERFQLC